MEVGGQVHILVTLPPWKETLISVEWKADGLDVIVKIKIFIHSTTTLS
jgi:hypothetical protein